MNSLWLFFPKSFTTFEKSFISRLQCKHNCICSNEGVYMLIRKKNKKEVFIAIGKLFEAILNKIKIDTQHARRQKSSATVRMNRRL